jgi:REP element-mobilizing transposase RayT
MARPLRVHIPGALYHVMSRGNARQEIFLDSTDYECFLTRFAVVSARFAVRCRAFCLMPNHFHLLLEPNQFPIPRLMQQLNSSYCQWFNGRHTRVGHVLQGRYKAFVIDREQYYRRVLRYIVLNPVRARLVVHPAQWPWSSYLATAGFVEPASFLSLSDVWNVFHPDDQRSAHRIYDEFVCGAVSHAAAMPAGPAVGSDELAVRITDALTAHRDAEDLRYAERFAVRPPLELVLAPDDDPRVPDVALREAFEYYGYTLKEIAGFIGRHPCTVWRRIRRIGRDSPPPEVSMQEIKI